LTGPAGFTINLGACPTISGAVAAYGAFSRVSAVIFDYYNKKGGFKDGHGKTPAHRLRLPRRRDGPFPLWTNSSIPIMLLKDRYELKNERVEQSARSVTYRPVRLGQAAVESAGAYRRALR
jgi:hypothetical protein